MGEDDAEACRRERPYSAVRDLAQRTGLSEDELRALVECGACDGFGRRRRDLLWQLGLVRGPPSVPGTAGEAKQLALPLEPTAATPDLPELTLWERMLADYRTTGLSVGVHPLTLLRPHLPRGTLSSAELRERRTGQTSPFAGLVVARQRPSTANGIVFMLLEDEHGQVNLVSCRRSTSGTGRSCAASRSSSSAVATSTRTATATSSSASSCRSPRSRGADRRSGRPRRSPARPPLRAPLA